MYKKLYGALYLLNIVLQGFWCLMFPMGVAFGLGWLAVRYISWPTWCYVPLMLIGAIVGLISMCRFLISATNAMDRLERQRKRDSEAKKPHVNKDEKKEKEGDNEDE